VNPIRTNAIILSKASLFIGNNSGQIHLAASYGIPSILIYGSDTNLANHYIKKWLPWQKRIETYICPTNKTDESSVLELMNIVRSV
jgi:ADP-heptose:LPS heptosyltransferase